MGGSVAVRHGALYRPEPGGECDGECSEAHGAHEGRTGARSDTDTGGSAPTAHADVAAHAAHADAVVAVSAPARWYYRGTAPMRRLHWVVQRPVGRLVGRYGLRTRIHADRWDPVPLPPVAAAPLIAPRPLLVVHGDSDPYFPLDHPRALAAAAASGSTELWIEPGFGHAENAANPALLHRIGSWASARCRADGRSGDDGDRNTDG